MRHACARAVRAGLIGLVSMLSASALCADGRTMPIPGISGQDDRIIRDSRAHPWRAIGRLNSTLGPFCTATVIGSRQVLTAAHCLWNRHTGRWLPPCALHFLADYRRGEYGVHALVAEFHIGDGFDMRTPRLSSDWAVLTLDRDVSAITGRVELAEAAIASGDALIQAGYSRDRPHLLTVDRGCSVSQASRRQTLFTHDCDATFGDSGSPLLTLDPRGYRLVGLHSAMLDRDGQAQGIAVSVQAFRRWVEAHPVTRPLGGVESCAVTPSHGNPLVAGAPSN